MNILMKHFFSLFCAHLILASGLYTQDAITPHNNGSTNRTTKRFHFNFTNKALIDLINELAATRNVNIILPQGTFPATTTITYHLPEPLNIDQAWKQLISILEIAGYTIAREGNFTYIYPIDTNIMRQPLEIYIDEPLENIPDTEKIIKAVFYLQNLSISKSKDNINTILKDMLSTTANIILEDKTNAILVTDKANNIKSVMKIIQELDKGGFRESIEVLPLYYISASQIETLFKNLLGTNQQDSMPSPQPRVSNAYFPKNTKVMSIGRTNSLVIMGTPFAIDLVKDFIIKYIDKPLESGESILHVYELQYLKAETFEGYLKKMITPASTEQAAGQVLIGAKQYFKDVIVVAEKISKTEAAASTTVAGQTVQAPTPTGAQIGGNRLIIAARKQDWIRIEKLIKELDKPQPQVALEVLIVDITLDSDRLLGTQMRNRQGFNDSISKNINFQTAHLTNPILKPKVSVPGVTEKVRPADALMANLLQLGDSFADGKNFANSAPAGSFIISFNDNKESGVWAIWQIINSYTNATILAQPFITTKNHMTGTVTISEQRFLQGSASTANVSAVVTNQYVPASLVVDMTPHISSSSENINLQITVNLNEFISEDASNNSRITRIVQTNTNIGNNQILALGGLTRIREEISNHETPFLSNIPIFGWLFKKSQKEKTKNNLVILICPTIIEPQAQGGINSYTQRKLDFAQNDLDEHLLFENLRDPITRWFFQPDPCYGQRIIEGYKTEAAEHLNDNAAPVFTKNTSNLPMNVPPISITESERLKMMVQNEENPLSSQGAQKQVDLL